MFWLKCPAYFGRRTKFGHPEHRGAAGGLAAFAAGYFARRAVGVVRNLGFPNVRTQDRLA